MSGTALTHDRHHVPGSGFADLAAAVSKFFDYATADAPMLFRARLTRGRLFDAYLDGFDDPVERQHHNCSTCRSFIERFGGLLVVHEDGSTMSAVWPANVVPGDYAMPIANMRRIAEAANVIDPAILSEADLGSAWVGGWQHFHVTAPAHLVHTKAVKTAGQFAAELREDIARLRRYFGSVKASSVEAALTLLRAGRVNSADQFIGPAEFLLRLFTDRGRNSERRFVRSVATAPAGYRHVTTSVVAEMIADLEAGMSQDKVVGRFNAKVAPTAYQRPKAEPTAGNIARAEALVEKMGIAKSLERRFARLDEVKALWRPKEAGGGSGVFGHLKPKGGDLHHGAASGFVTMTLEKFVTKILPTVDRMRLRAPNDGPYIGLLTAVHPDAPPVLKWDNAVDRNPVSWFFYANGSSCDKWGLRAGWVDVVAVSDMPTMWGKVTMPNLGRGAIFYLSGAHHVGSTESCLFPQILKSDLHEVRSTIEAHSGRTRVSPISPPAACGIGMTASSVHKVPLIVRAVTGTTEVEYHLDRWE